MQIPGMGRQQSCRGCRTWMAKLSYIIKQLEIREENIWEKEGGNAIRVKLESMFFVATLRMQVLRVVRVQEN